MSKGLQIAVGALLCAALLGWYGYTNLQDASTYRYYDTLEEFLAQGPQAAAARGESMRIKGYVATGSIERAVAERQVRFAIQNDPPHAGGSADASLRVLYPSLETPDLFKDGAEVVVEGRVESRDGAAVFVADNVLAKCPSKFQAQAGAGAGAGGEDAPAATPL